MNRRRFLALTAAAPLVPLAMPEGEARGELLVPDNVEWISWDGEGYDIDILPRQNVTYTFVRTAKWYGPSPKVPFEK